MGCSASSDVHQRTHVSRGSILKACNGALSRKFTRSSLTPLPRTPRVGPRGASVLQAEELARLLALARTKDEALLVLSANGAKFETTFEHFMAETETRPGSAGSGASVVPLCPPDRKPAGSSLESISTCPSKPAPWSPSYTCSVPFSGAASGNWSVPFSGAASGNWDDTLQQRPMMMRGDAFLSVLHSESCEPREPVTVSCLSNSCLQVMCSRPVIAALEVRLTPRVLHAFYNAVVQELLESVGYMTPQVVLAREARARALHRLTPLRTPDSMPQ